MTDAATPEPVTVVGAGIAGAACAVALTAAGVPVRLVERGRTPGGRMASPRIHGRPVDLGAGYLTVKDDDFDAVVQDWRARGLARSWTDTFSVLAPGAPPQTKSGPVRWGTPGGLRSLVADLLAPVRADLGGVALQTEPAGLGDLPGGGPVVLAMPDPQAQRLLADVEVPGWAPIASDPVIAVACGHAERGWPDLHDAAFVHDHPDLDFVADDGARRGDGAPVLVAHTTAERAGAHLDDPDAAVPAVTTALTDLLGAPEPRWTHAHRWRFAQPADAHDAAYLLTEVTGPHGPRMLGLAGDQWCPSGSPRVESAWLSGTRLGRALAERLGR